MRGLRPCSVSCSLCETPASPPWFGTGWRGRPGSWRGGMQSFVHGQPILVSRSLFPPTPTPAPLPLRPLLTFEDRTRHRRSASHRPRRRRSHSHSNALPPLDLWAETLDLSASLSGLEPQRASFRRSRSGSLAGGASGDILGARLVVVTGSPFPSPAGHRRSAVLPAAGRSRTRCDRVCDGV